MNLPPRYIVPDTCALAAALYNEPYSGNVDPLLDAIRFGTVDAIAPTLCMAEFLNVSRKKRQSGLSDSQVEKAILDFLSLPIVWIEMDRSVIYSAWQLHFHESVETADAVFAEIAIQWQAEIWTSDDRFITKLSPHYSKIFDFTQAAFL